MTIARGFTDKIAAAIDNADELKLVLIELQNSKDIIARYREVINGADKEGILFKDGSLAIMAMEGKVLGQGTMNGINVIYALLRYHPFPELEKNH